MGTDAAIAVGLVIYAVAMLALSTFLTKRIAKTTDYLMGGWNFPFWILIGSITAANIGTGVIVCRRMFALWPPQRPQRALPFRAG